MPPTSSAAVVSAAQRALPYNPRNAIFATVTLAGDTSAARDRVLEAVKALDAEAAAKPEQTGVVVCVAPATWAEWGYAAPGGPPEHTIVGSNGHFRQGGGHLVVQFKSERAEHCRELLEKLRESLGELAAEIATTEAERSPDRKILDHHYYDGLTNSADPLGIADAALISDAGQSTGGSWALTQTFGVDWKRFLAMGVDRQVDVIGRGAAGSIVPDDHAGSHIRRARIFDGDHSNPKVLRLSMPFGAADEGKGREAGIYFTAYSNDAGRIERILRSMVGDGNGHGPADDLLRIVGGEDGGWWYVPSAAELGLDSGIDPHALEMDPFWAERSSNDLMFYNSVDYLHTMGTGRYAPGDPPSDRILELLAATTSRWRDNWYEYLDPPRLPHLSELLDPGEEAVLDAPVAIRMGTSAKKSLTRVHTNDAYPQTADRLAWQEDVFRIHPDDLLFGVMPELSLGRGKEFVRYLRDDERYPAMLLGLSEGGAMGHIVPDHGVVLRSGLGKLIDDLAARRDAAGAGAERDFFESCRLALEGVQGYCENWALLAERTAADTADPARKANLEEIAERARRLASEPPTSFLDAVQLLFTVHCCLHLLGDPTAIGRLDQLLEPFYEGTPEAEAQEALDALWVKLGEKAIHNRHAITDHNEPGMTAVSYSSDGNFPQGGAINQWVQQVTVGGYKPTADAQPESAINDVTILCLRSSRRLPLNAPCVSLRLHPGMPPEILEEAGRALLSGGAHPILFQEDRMVEALGGYSGFPLEAARDYACDGCYEPMIAGATEFAFGNIAPLDVLEMTLNQGATWNIAGPEFLRGTKASFRSPPAAQITSFDQLKEIYLQHLEWQCVKFFHDVLSGYGNLNQVCPDPLLSVLIHDCVESGRDFTNGGARYHLVAPMFVGLATTIDSLYAIEQLVFGAEPATTLPDLVTCLMSDWGHGLQEPWQSTLSGPHRSAGRARHFEALRKKALALPKFGTGHADVDAIAAWLVEACCDTAMRVMADPPPGLREVLDGISKRYSTPERPHTFHVCPGAGTFEGYVGDGLGSGASADGRRKGQPYPSDLSPAPIPQDLPPVPQDTDGPLPLPGAYREVYSSLSSWDQDALVRKLSNAGPIDLNVREDFPLEDLVELLRRYSEGEVGGNLLTVSCADPDTYAGATIEPERYELVRVRMGGWTEYFSAMFPAHQAQHQRRPFFIPLKGHR